MPCSSQPNGEFARTPTRIFVWRQSLRVGVRADGADPYGKSEPLRGARGGPRRRRVPAAQGSRRREAESQGGRRGHTRRGRRGLPAGPGASGVRRRGRLGGPDRPRPGFQGGAAAAAAGSSPPPPAPSSNTAESRSPSGSPSSGSCAATFPSSVRPRKPSHESYDSVSTTPTPSARPRPPASQPMAVTTAVEATRPPRQHST